MDNTNEELWKQRKQRFREVVPFLQGQFFGFCFLSAVVLIIYRVNVAAICFKLVIRDFDGLGAIESENIIMDTMVTFIYVLYALQIIFQVGGRLLYVYDGE